MDVFERDGGASTADTVHKRAEFLHLVSDADCPRRSAPPCCCARSTPSYDQIAEAMDTTVPSVKSLLVRARVSLAEAAEARLLTCDEVRLELGQVAEGLGKTSAPARRHLRSCERCRVFKSELRKTTRALAAVYPIGPLVFLKKLSLAKLGIGGAAPGAAATGGAGSGAAGHRRHGGHRGRRAHRRRRRLRGGVGTIASKAAAGVAAAAIVTAGAVEVRHATVAQPPASPASSPPPLPRSRRPRCPPSGRRPRRSPQPPIPPPSGHPSRPCPRRWLPLRSRLSPPPPRRRSSPRRRPWRRTTRP